MPPASRTRQACDRCHGQKLRCPKQAGSAICARCSKAGVSCVYSPAGSLPTPQSIPVLDGPLFAETATLDWNGFSFDHLLSPQGAQQPDENLLEKEPLPVVPLDPRARCFDRLSTMMARLNDAFNGLPPVDKLHVSAQNFASFCAEVSESYCIKQSLELMLCQTQELVDLYPDAIRLAFKDRSAPDCKLPDCVHTYKVHPNVEEDPFETEAAPGLYVDFTLLNQLISCHYRLHDITELILAHSQVCFKFAAACSSQGVEPQQLEIPKLRIGSFTPSARSSPSIVTAILVDLQTSLADGVPRLQASIAGNPSRECQVLSLQCDMLKERADSLVARLKNMRDVGGKSGFLG